MKNIFLTINILFLLIISCTSDKNADKDIDSINIDSAKVEETNAIDNNIIVKPDTTKNSAKDLPIYGDLSKASVANYYPNITDTIERIFNLTAHKLDLNPGNGFLVGMLFNSAVSSQMFLCTHDSKLNLIDQLYIGTATDFDGGQSHTIQTKIINNNEIIFDQIDWGNVKDSNNNTDVDTIGHQIWDVMIDKNGRIKNKITVVKKYLVLNKN